MRNQRWWTWHIAAGAVILVFLGLHMVVMHLDALVGVFNADPGEHPIGWTNVLERSRSAFFMVTYVVLLAAALFHGLYGLRNILVELNPAPALRRAIGVVLALGGFGLFGFGAWAAWVSFVWLRAAQ